MLQSGGNLGRQAGYEVVCKSRLQYSFPSKFGERVCAAGSPQLKQQQKPKKTNQPRNPERKEGPSPRNSASTQNFSALTSQSREDFALSCWPWLSLLGSPHRPCLRRSRRFSRKASLLCTFHASFSLPL